jgi:hypothetical protein
MDKRYGTRDSMTPATHIALHQYRDELTSAMKTEREAYANFWQEIDNGLDDSVMINARNNHYDAHMEMLTG